MFTKIKEYAPSGEKIAEQLLRPFQQFAEKEAASSILLLAATVCALIWANSPFHELYDSFRHTRITISAGPYIIEKTVLHWINDGLMAFFFFTVGLEIKQEMIVGELSTFRRAFLPAAAAMGGMIFPALIFFLLTRGTPGVHGWGIPMATDIAFALGALAVIGERLPLGLRAFLSAFAIADDLGAVLVIAVFYTETIVLHYLIIAVFILAALAVANLLWIRNALVYAILGVGLWLMIIGSGIHATVAGILVALFIPAKGKYDTDNFINNVKSLVDKFECEESSCGRSILLNEKHLNAVKAIGLAAYHAETPLQRLEHSLYPWVAFVIIPLFALANAGIRFTGTDLLPSETSQLTLGIILGLLLGKPLGITLFSYLAVKLGLASLPRGVDWLHITGAGILGGIGFTMSLFIMGLSYREEILLRGAQVGILVGSILAALIGLAFLYRVTAASNPGRKK